MQEMGKHSLNPDLVLFFLLLRENKKGKGKERGTEAKCTWPAQRDKSVLKGRRTIRDWLEQQGEPEWARGAAHRARRSLPKVQGSSGVFTPGHGNCHNPTQLPPGVEK